jgi:hypothetical protein
LAFTTASIPSQHEQFYATSIVTIDTLAALNPALFLITSNTTHYA